MSEDSPVALVTGSTSGIGEAVVRRLVHEGYRVVINSVKSVDAGEKLAAELGADVAHYVQGDVAVLDDAQRLVRDVRVPELGPSEVTRAQPRETTTPRPRQFCGGA